MLGKNYKGSQNSNENRQVQELLYNMGYYPKLYDNEGNPLPKSFFVNGIWDNRSKQAYEKARQDKKIFYKDGLLIPASKVKFLNCLT